MMAMAAAAATFLVGATLLCRLRLPMLLLANLAAMMVAALAVAGGYAGAGSAILGCMALCAVSQTGYFIGSLLIHGLGAGAVAVADGEPVKTGFGMTDFRFRS